MSLRSKLILLLTIVTLKAFTQCLPVTVIPTLTISTLYSGDLNPAPGSSIYITPTGTVTGNIRLVNSSLYNCGTILSGKIVMRQSLYNNINIIDNYNVMRCDSVLLDSLGHLHNTDTLICNLLKLNYNTNVDNVYLMEAGNLKIENESKLNSAGTVKAKYFEIKNTYSNFYNSYGNISVQKLFKVGTGSVIYGIVFICVDSCFINNGLINSRSMPSWTPSIRVSGESTNTGTINLVDFCDLSSSNGGMPDLNTGSLSNITFCSSEQYYCYFNINSLKENHSEKQTVLIYPNPTSNDLNINVNDNKFDYADIEIIDNLGRTLFKQPFSSKISVSTLSNGYYTLRICTKEQQFYSRFIKN